MPVDPAALLERGRGAFSARQWSDAYRLLTKAGEQVPLDPDDLERLATAAHLTGESESSTARWSEAHQAFIERGATGRAALCAFWLARALLLQGQRAPAAGWMARAHDLLDANEECVEQGYLLLPQALERLFAGDAAGSYDMFTRAGDLADRFGDRDLLALTRHNRGRVLIRMGKVDEGMQLLDAAMVAIDADEVSPLAAGDVYCSVIEGCLEVFDLRRAREWTESLDRWCESQPDLVPYRGQCRVRRAEMLQLLGAWPEAIEAARQQCVLPTRSSPRATTGDAFYRCAEIHRLRGELAEADEAYRDANRLGRQPQPGLALLRLSQGRPAAAGAAIRTAVETVRAPAVRPAVLAAYVDIMIAVGDLAAARSGTEELAAIAGRLRAPMLEAAAATARGAVLLAEGDAQAALPLLAEARMGWQNLDASYDAARVRLLLAAACRDLGNGEAAEVEIDAARWTFEQLGARPDLARAQELARTLEAGTAHPLSAREVQVLRLIAAGHTNRQVAVDLGISERTVERHVSNIFDKLGLSSRSAATAYAYEHRLV